MVPTHTQREKEKKKMKKKKKKKKNVPGLAKDAHDKGQRHHLVHIRAEALVQRHAQAEAVFTLAVGAGW